MLKILKELKEEFSKVEKDNFTKSDIDFIISNFTEKTQKHIISVNGITIDNSSFVLTIDDKKYHIPRKQFKMLFYLLSNPNRCINRREFINNCWEDGVIVGERTIDVHICKLKKLLKDKIDIKTNKCYGYRWKTY